ncbi:MAG: beta-galactosidase [Candidatus Brocadia sp.]|nr:beta-galactosidase [Candidatus Brocadia sp.]
MVHYKKNTIELIQQWQYTGEVNPSLLEDKSFGHVKASGLTSLQSYVYWAEIEKDPGKIDFSSYDPLVEKIIRHNLKWVPFLILGPCYATPAWFQVSDESVFARCLEHGVESKIQSIWNPYLPRYVDRFLGVFAKHYQEHGLFESISLGISGNWGEAMYPVGGGFGTNFHTHSGWWCGDKYAIESYRQYLFEKYKDIRQTNDLYKTCFSDFQEITFPREKRTNLDNLRLKIKEILPGQVKQLLRPFYKTTKSFWGDVVSPSIRWLYSDSTKTYSIHEQYRWVDFVNWYIDSMNKWSDFWLSTARKYFVDIEIYLVTGGYGLPQAGTDFSAQTKVAKKYNAGIRITNQTDNYSDSFIYTRLVSSSCRHYGSYFTTEEELVNQPKGVTMRIFDAATSGAKGSYFKSIIGTGTDICTGKVFPLGEPTMGALNLRQNIGHYKLDNPIIETAVLFANTTIAITPSFLYDLYKQCSTIRSYVDIDLVDENMIGDRVLSKYRFLILLGDNILHEKTLNSVLEWIKNGGVLIKSSYFKIIPFYNEGRGIYQIFPEKSGVNKVGKGYTLTLSKWGNRFIEAVASSVYNEEGMYPWKGIEKIKGFSDGVYATRFSDRILFYDSRNSEIRSELLKRT